MLTIKNYDELEGGTFMVHSEEWSVGYVRDMSKDDSFFDEPYY